jgi:nicotinamidase-related amidase
MTGRVWERFLTEEDKAALAASGFGCRVGFGARPALLIIDVSYAFCGDGPDPLLQSIRRMSTACGARAWAAIPVIRALIDAFHAKRLPVIYTTNGFRPDGWDLASWQWKLDRISELTSPPLSNFDPNAIVREIAPASQDIIIVKQKPSAFFGTPLMSYLHLLGVDSLIITGTSTSGCVRAAVVDAFSLNFRCAVVEDACFDRTEASHAINLFDMHSKYADICSSEEVQTHVRDLANDLFPQLPQGRG